MNGDLTFSVNNQCWCIINDHIFRDVQAAPWPNFQLTTQPLNAIFRVALVLKCLFLAKNTFSKKWSCLFCLLCLFNINFSNNLKRSLKNYKTFKCIKLAFIVIKLIPFFVHNYCFLQNPPSYNFDITCI